MIRADLVYRVDSDEPGLPMSSYEWVNLNYDSIRTLSECVDHGVALECVIAEDPCPLIRSAHPPPLHYRIRLICNHINGVSMFPLTCFGLYALNLAALEPVKGEKLLLTMPRIYLKRPPRKKNESKYEITMGGPELGEIGEAGRKPLIVIQTPRGMIRPLDKRGTTEDIMFNPSTCKRDYTSLRDLQLDKREYNVWGVVTKIKRDPSPTSRQFIMATVYIMDEHYQGSFNFPDFQFSILSKDVNDFLPLRPGSIIRIHNMHVREWSDALTGCVFDAKLVTLVKWDEQGFPKPIYKSKHFVWTEEDKRRAKELHRWWTETLEPKERENILSNALEIGAVKSYCRFDLYCVVMNKFVIDEDDFVLNVSDGTLSPILSESFVIEDNSFSFQPREGKYDIDIFFRGQQGLYNALSVGDCILLTQVLCFLEKEVENRPIYKFSVERNSNSSCKKMEFNHPVTMDIKKRIEKISTKVVVLEENDSDSFSQKSAKSGRRLDQLNLRSQKSYVETMSTTTSHIDQTTRYDKKDDDDILSSSALSSENGSELYQSLSSIFKSVEEDSFDLKKIIELSDIPQLMTSSYGHFYTRGIIKSIHPIDPTQMVITVCSSCSHAKSIENLKVNVVCQKCGGKLITSFNFQIVIQKGFDFIDVYVSGYNAELFLGTSAADFLKDKRVQGEISNKFKHFVMNRLVELNVAFSNCKGVIEYYSMGKPHFPDAI